MTKHRSKILSVLLSIRSEHIVRIFNGSKRYELRKALPVEPFARVFMYETGGGGIVGSFEIGRVIHEEKGILWKAVGTKATTKERFDAYFASVKKGYAIEIRDVVRFKHPVTAADLDSSFVKLIPPQNFLLLERTQPLFRILEQRRSEAITTRRHVSLTKIQESEKPLYRKLVLKHVGAQYDEIDASFADRTLEIHDLGHDPTGFFTTNKEVLSVTNDRDKLVGFTTLTLKSGGCVKTGPTILLQKFRRQGYGSAIRHAIEERVRHAARKIYCTCPDDAEETIQYLMSSGMRIEAHLEQHYSTAHDELVFGKMLEADQRPSIENFDRSFSVESGTVTDAVELSEAELASQFQVLFTKTWAPVTKEFATKIIRESLSFSKKRTAKSNKPKKLIYLLSEKKECLAAIVLLPKRGGSVKGLIMRQTSHISSLTELVNRALQLTADLSSRRLYFLHPVLDSTALILLRGCGFQVEGILRAPYTPGVDVAVLARFI